MVDVNNQSGLREKIAAFAKAFVTEQSEGEWGDELIAKDAAKLTDAVLALISPAGEVSGWQPIETAEMWEEYAVTDGEHIAIAAKSEADYGGHYWAVDGGNGCIEWEPTHYTALPAAPRGMEG